MELNDEQVQKLLEWYLTISKTREWINFRNQEHEKNHSWIKPGVIEDMGEDELKERFFDYFKGGGGRQNLNQIYRDRIIRNKDLKKTLLYLFNEQIDIKERINSVLDGDGHIEGMGKAIVTSLLMDYDIGKYCLWNEKTMMGFSALGIDIEYKGLKAGEVYLNVLEELERIKSLKTEYNLTFEDIDLFLHTISAVDEGVEAVSTIIQGEDLSGDSYIDIEGLKSMEFAMEKYLEEFIESNFDKIDFGAKLKLYQDEENTGRQYITSVGRIDLLAFDEEKKEFVVIELKKGQSSDVVVGQITRYMGWVKENLAKNYFVRGIIIAKEKDERLEYSLKVVPSVDLFLYNINFDIINL
ncbi:DUF1016 family protein [Methanobacterium sp. CWC-01]|uniref:endonuclease NucS domain-containing protein n=1 Tax=Methanobacterium aridiramus TaxID=2584467 RepID=UPI002578D408|nr:endonuclease NucS domain-containing protein [Methanobacterium sp. CWC-01]WJI09504.1 DUF1016 family protein [Methanobacterium sp. CWC-01]